MENINVNTTIDLQTILLAIGLYCTILFGLRRTKREEDEGTGGRFKRVHERIDSTDREVGSVKERMSVVESQMEGVAKHADVEALRSEMKQVRASQTRIEDFLLK